ncbi:MAG: replication initiation protein [Flectobacillus sp.]|uniref:replication initiation protein n=1 Tax=Flectobacillus sp. TaxID=50419 RepID=UPI003B9C67F1
MKKLSLTESDSTVAQHNELVKARFNMSLMETRLFVALLARINKGDTEFALCRIPIAEVCANVDGGKSYIEVKEAVIKLSSKVITIETVDNNGKHEIISDPLMATCRYKDGSGFIVAQLNHFVKPYLLQLKGNFTVAEIKVLLQLRSYYSYRIYWLLKSTAYSANNLTIEVQELRSILGIENQYPNFYDFKRWVLLVSQKELASTDMSFSFKEIKDGRAVKYVEFAIDRQMILRLDEDIILPVAIQSKLSENGISLNSMQEISDLLKSGVIDDDYILYVINELSKKKDRGNIKSLSGAIYVAIVKQQLLKEYLELKNSKIYKQPNAKTVPTTKEATTILKLEEQREGFDLMKKRGMTEFDTFDDFLENLLQSGFRYTRQNGVELLIKE